MNLLEIAVYALVVSGQNTPFACAPYDGKYVACTNGMVATTDRDNNIHFKNGVVITKDARGGITFSNGVTAHFDSTGWVKFSNGYVVRKDFKNRNQFNFSNGLQCELVKEDRAVCQTGSSGR
ncbi:MliC domain-containing protein [Azospirillaceae bacterium]